MKHIPIEIARQYLAVIEYPSEADVLRELLLHGEVFIRIDGHGARIVAPIEIDPPPPDPPRSKSESE